MERKNKTVTCPQNHMADPMVHHFYAGCFYYYHLVIKASSLDAGISGRDLDNTGFFYCLGFLHFISLCNTSLIVYADMLKNMSVLLRGNIRVIGFAFYRLQLEYADER